MLVVKRDGTPQPIDFEKIHWRIKSMSAKPEILNFQKEQRPEAYKLFSKLPPIYYADVDLITKKTIEGIYDNMLTTEIDKLSAEIAQEMCTNHPDNSTLASRILISNLQKNVLENMVKRFPLVKKEIIEENLFQYVMSALYFNKNKHGEHSPLVSPYLLAISMKYSKKINDLIDYSRDFTNHDYLGIKTLENGYLFKVHSMDNFLEKNIILECPSIADMRIAIALVCAPSPCPKPYDDVDEFVQRHPEVFKEKYPYQKTFDKNKVKMKLFKELYWSEKLDNELSNINNLSEYQWKRIKEIYDGMTTGRFTPATPTRFSAGSIRPQGSSCFLIAMEDDSLKGIYNTLLDQTQISKYAGGVGLWAHNIRSFGSYISGTNGISNGLKPMLQVFDTSSKYVDQGGGKRAGTVAIYLEPWHFDIIDFLKLKRKKGADTDRARNLFYALWIPDEYFRCLKENKEWYLFDPAVCPKLYDSYDSEFSSSYLSDDFIFQNKDKYLFTYRYRKYIRQGKYEKKISAESLMEEVVETVRDSGVPYMLSKDACNRKSNQKNLGVIKSSNLCVSGDTYILTDKGQNVIKDIVDQKVNVWNGEEFSSTVVRKTGIDVKLLRIKLSNGVELKCTPEHKFYIISGSRNQKQIMVQASQLKLDDDRLIKYNLPILNLEDTVEMKYAYTHGFFCGDGTTYDNYSKTKKYPKAYLYGEKKDLLAYLDYESCSENVKSDRYDLVLPKDLKEKFYVPMNQSINTMLKWFEGYCDADGTISRNGTNESLQISSIEKEFLLKIKLMLQTLGIDSKVTKNMNARITLMPDHKGGQKEYNGKELYRILISSSNLYKLSKLGFNPKRLVFDKVKPQRDATQFIKVVSIEEVSEREDTYCFTEEKRNMGMFNGVLTGQCTEIIQYSDDKETAVCNLHSICLNKFVREFQEGDNENFKYNVSLTGESFWTFDWNDFANTVRISQNNIDRLIDINYYPTEKSRLSNMRHKPTGIGIQGEADMFALLRLPWNSKEAHRLRFHIFERMYYECLKASVELAKIYGPYESFQGSPASLGKLQFDLWKDEGKKISFQLSLPWDSLKEDIRKHGLRNSLFIAPMPTVSTSNIMGNSPSFEPFNSLVYVKKSGTGDVTLMNKNMVNDLMSIGLWNKSMSDKILTNHGSIQDILEIPKKLRESYLTVYDLEPEDIIDAAYVRAWFVDQSQSMNLFFKNVNMAELSKAWTRGWLRGLKTLSYYCRTRPSTVAQKAQLIKSEKIEKSDEKYNGKVCSRDDPDCLSCGS